MKTTITGTALGHPISLTIESDLDGKEVAKYVCDVYTEVMQQIPDTITKLEKQAGPIKKALIKLNKILYT